VSLLSHSILCTSNYYIIKEKEKEKEIKCFATTDSLARLPFHYTILYEANVPADPNLWDSHFGPISLFGTNKFLQSDTCNILCSLLHMAEFVINHPPKPKIVWLEG